MIVDKKTGQITSGNNTSSTKKPDPIPVDKTEIVQVASGGIIDAYKAIPYYLNTVKEFHKIFNNGLLTGYLLSIIGVFTSYSLQRQNVNTYEIRKIGEK